MFTESTALYDLIYAQFKNYSEEAARLDAPLRRVHPLCISILDVA